MLVLCTNNRKTEGCQIITKYLLQPDFQKTHLSTRVVTICDLSVFFFLFSKTLFALILALIHSLFLIYIIILNPEQYTQTHTADKSSS